MIFTISIPKARGCGTIPTGKALVAKTKRNAFMAQNPNAPTRDSDAYESSARVTSEPTEPLHNPPRADPTPNPVSDPPPELPNGVVWC
jgi:hypothetical protein